MGYLSLNDSKYCKQSSHQLSYTWIKNHKDSGEKFLRIQDVHFFLTPKLPDFSRPNLHFFLLKNSLLNQLFTVKMSKALGICSEKIFPWPVFKPPEFSWPKKNFPPSPDLWTAWNNTPETSPIEIKSRNKG